MNTKIVIGFFVAIVLISLFLIYYYNYSDYAQRRKGITDLVKKANEYQKLSPEEKERLKKNAQEEIEKQKEINWQREIERQKRVAQKAEHKKRKLEEKERERQRLAALEENEIKNNETQKTAVAAAGKAISDASKKPQEKVNKGLAKILNKLNKIPPSDPAKALKKPSSASVSDPAQLQTAVNNIYGVPDEPTVEVILPKENSLEPTNIVGSVSEPANIVGSVSKPTNTIGSVSEPNKLDSAIDNVYSMQETPSEILNMDIAKNEGVEVADEVAPKKNIPNMKIPGKWPPTKGKPNKTVQDILNKLKKK